MAISRLIHCGSHDPWLSVLKCMAKSTELLKKSFRANGKLELPTKLMLCPLEVHNIIDEDIKTFGRVPRGCMAMHGSIFIRQDSYVASSILCIVKGNSQCSSDLPQHRWAGIFSVRRIY